jgi:uncharacterized membrane protein YbhN (UPF0104 family)
MSPGPLIRLAAQIAVSAALLTGLLWSVDMGAIMDAMAGVSPRGVVAVAVALFAALILAQSLRWILILRQFGTHLPLAAAARMVGLAMFINQVVPAMVAGDASRVWQARAGAPLRDLIESVVIDRVAGGAALAILCAAALPSLNTLAGAGTVFWSVAGLVATAAGGLAVATSFHHLPPAYTRLWGVRDLASVSANLWAVLRSGRRAAAILTLGLLSHTALIWAALTLSGMIGVDITPGQAMTVLPPVLFVAMMPISLAGWGVREGAMAVGLGLLAVPVETAIAISILFGATSVVVGVLGGLLWLAGRLVRPWSASA